MSVTASDDAEATSTSATTDPSVTEQEQPSIDEKPASSPQNMSSPTASRTPVQLLRRQPNTAPSPQMSRQATPTAGDIRRPSPTRTESAAHASVKESVDPSLVEAFANPMNRQYLLQLEARLNEFVTQSK